MGEEHGRIGISDLRAVDDQPQACIPPAHEKECW
jgi:hypothetical protein